VLVEFGVGSSLLSTQNMRVEGWRLRLLELLPDQQAHSGFRFASGRRCCDHLHPSNLRPVDPCSMTWVQGAVDAELFGGRLNELLLKQAAGITPRAFPGRGHCPLADPAP
jgi:protein phosphatase